MRCLEINKKTFYALNYKGQSDVIDEEGNFTGETIVEYSKPIQIRANISGARGSSQIEMFGNETQYDKTIVMSKQYFEKLGIDENSVFFIGKKPIYDKENNPLYNYRVYRIAEVINEIAIAIEEVKAN